MPPIDPEREAVGRSIAAFLMAGQIRQAGQIHSETVLADIGALAGFAAQISIRKGVIEPQGLDPNAVLAEIVTKNDEKYYFSELLNWILFENLDAPPYSIWAYVRDAVPEQNRHGPVRGAAAAARAHAAHAAARRAARALARGAAGARGVEPRSIGMAVRSRMCSAVADADQPRPARAAAGGDDRHGSSDPDVEGRSAQGAGGVTRCRGAPYGAL